MNFSIKELTMFEKILWIISVITVTVSSVISKDFNFFTLIASLIGVTALILCAKGNVWGQILIIIFALLYAVISFSQKYYGEMITYLGMSAPIAGISVY
ncbi:MAG: nicotinamide mononucleotide transporter, partial [Ruminococcus sp.]|nr:nicotinamide mononucleotide transporter [Ruminococcus sp.]